MEILSALAFIRHLQEVRGVAGLRYQVRVAGHIKVGRQEHRDRDMQEVLVTIQHFLVTSLQRVGVVAVAREVLEQMEAYQ